MTNDTTPRRPADRPADRPVDPPRPAPAPLPWLLMLGLASLVLLWPLTQLLGLGEGAPRALLVLAVIALGWIGTVGLGRVARPVLVLTLTGLLAGLVLLVLAAVLGDGGRPWWTHPIALVIDTFWGMVAGLLALAVQQLRRPARPEAQR